MTLSQVRSHSSFIAFSSELMPLGSEFRNNTNITTCMPMAMNWTNTNVAKLIARAISWARTGSGSGI